MRESQEESALPLYFCDGMSFEIFVGLGKWSAPEETFVSRKWRRMWRGYDAMLGGINEGFFGDRIVTPEDKY